MNMSILMVAIEFLQNILVKIIPNGLLGILGSIISLILG